MINCFIFPTIVKIVTVTINIFQPSVVKHFLHTSDKKIILVHIDWSIRDQSTIWEILNEALAEFNSSIILNEASAEFNISKMTRHRRLERNTNNIVRGFSRVQYCWFSSQANCGVLFWTYSAMIENCTVNMDFISSLGNTQNVKIQRL